MTTSKLITQTTIFKCHLAADLNRMFSGELYRRRKGERHITKAVLGVQGAGKITGAGFRNTLHLQHHRGLVHILHLAALYLQPGNKCKKGWVGLFDVVWETWRRWSELFPGGEGMKWSNNETNENQPINLSLAGIGWGGSGQQQQR